VASYDWPALDRSQVIDPDVALDREWTLTSRAGCTAAGTALGACARSSHGTLMVTDPSGERRVLVAKMDEEIEILDRDGGERIALATNEYHDGTIHPGGHLHLESVRRDEDRVVWRWRVREITIEKSISLLPRKAATVVRYRVVDSPQPIRLRVTIFLANRTVNERTQGALDWRYGIESRAYGIVARAWPEAMPVGVFGWSAHHGHVSPGLFVQTDLWYWRFLHRNDRADGYPYVEDLFSPGLMAFDLQTGGEATILASGGAADPGHPQRMEVRLAHELEAWTMKHQPPDFTPPPWLAARPDHFDRASASAVPAEAGR